MTDSIWGTRAASLFDRLHLLRAADAFAALVAASLPWSTTATSILIIPWLITLLATLDVATLRREIMTAAGGTPLILVGLAVLGTLWADIAWGQRLWGVEGYLKLLLIPFLLAQFRRSPNGHWPALAFLAAALVLCAYSWFLVLTPGLSWRGKLLDVPGIPVKDHITQSGAFALCIFGGLGYAIHAWRNGQRFLAMALVFAAAAFLSNIAYVETGRTTLVVVAVMVPILGFREFGWRGMLAAAAAACMLAAALWASSPYLRYRVTIVAQEVERYRTLNEPTSTGARLDFWQNSVESIARAPIVGHGTGSVAEQLRSVISPATGLPTIGTVNPHNEILMVALQLGLIGTISLFAMWISHLLLFRGAGLVSWLGLVVVIENMVNCLANSHLTDFTQGWIYVFGVGTIGGAALRQRAPPVAGIRSQGTTPR
jgi:O-antigen ligase